MKNRCPLYLAILCLAVCILAPACITDVTEAESDCCYQTDGEQGNYYNNYTDIEDEVRKAQVLRILFVGGIIIIIIILIIAFWIHTSPDTQTEINRLARERAEREKAEMEKKAKLKAERAKLGLEANENDSERIAALKKEARQGDAESMGFLADYYIHGKGVEKSVEKGTALLRKSGYNEGHKVLWYEAGICYLEGDGTGVSEEKAIDCLRRSADYGYPEAKQKLEELESKKEEPPEPPSE